MMIMIVPVDFAFRVVDLVGADGHARIPCIAMARHSPIPGFVGVFVTLVKNYANTS
jgi:hypothetical protein